MCKKNSCQNTRVYDFIKDSTLLWTHTLGSGLSGFCVQGAFKNYVEKTRLGGTGKISTVCRVSPIKVEEFHQKCQHGGH